MLLSKFIEPDGMSTYDRSVHGDTVSSNRVSQWQLIELSIPVLMV
jgi:hypothetical protein